MRGQRLYMKYQETTYKADPILLRSVVISALVLCALSAQAAPADEQPYLCELGVQAGCGYYVGDATPHIFQNPREAFGAQFRYKFTPRWALQVKGMGHRITGPIVDEDGQTLETMWQNKMINIDAAAEFNFFRFGGRVYNNRSFAATPYIFVGVGMSLYNEQFHSVAAYFPVGFGLKWQFAKFVGLNIAWQHNIYIADNLEGIASMSNTYNLNGWNIMNNDLTSQLTLGIVFEFAHEKKVCKFCNGQ